MSDPVVDALAESARNRGLKLIRSRVRTPGKRRFGKVGLTDAAGKLVFGMDAKGPTAKPEQVEAYLRDLGAQDWGASLGASVRKHKAKRGAASATRHKASKQPTKPKAASRPKPEPKLELREAKAADAPALVPLMALLGHTTDEKAVRRRIRVLADQKLPQLVAAFGKRVVGLCGIHAMVAIHREQPVGRITILVVAEDLRGKSIGRNLVEAAEKQLRKLGCTLVEVTSNDRLTEAHAFYRHLGYERTSIRLVKTL